ncbi:Endoglucanase A [Micractinium conductrix]|uniref:Endoglucanase n=1 Tax=Micractinium conductrix TaxID=554055 RepID=A0A2P6VED4_9CHLO|nr:Endoglucanase A [Micractinium conductrix]|eukprot:PSC72455.1 Endoglucanase A [Micractinium conductrix]
MYMRARDAVQAVALLVLCFAAMQASADAAVAPAAGRRRRGSSGGVPQAVLAAFNPASHGGVDAAGGGNTGTGSRPRPPPPMRRQAPPRSFSRSAYATVLDRSLRFYEAQRSGQLPANNRVRWRRSAHLTDAVPGGYYDAGDYIKHSLTTAQASLFLAWAALDFGTGMATARQTAAAMAAVKWATDYLLNCSATPNQIVGLIGDPDVDHDYWGRPDEYTGPRRAYVWTRAMPASDLLGMTSAAMTSASLLFRKSNVSYADQLLRKATELYSWGAAVQGLYSESYPGYDSSLYATNRYCDKLLLAAAWLGRATGNATYFGEARQWWLAALEEDGGPNVFVSWDSVAPAAAELLTGQAARLGAARVPGAAAYGSFLDGAFLKSWSVADGTSSSYGVTQTPGGLRRPVWSRWGNTRYSCNAAFVALLRAVQLSHTSQTRRSYVAFARSQLDYALGSAGRSFVVGWGARPPLRAHHPGASCPGRPQPCGWDAFDSPAPNPLVLHGALVAGPAGPGDDTYRDKRDDYVTNEVAIDYNSGFSGALAGMVQVLAPAAS